MGHETMFDASHRNLILASEIAGLLHDLGKLRPEFALEKARGAKSLIHQVGNAVHYDAHGAILEAHARAYPPPDEDEWLQGLRQHEGWARVLRLPEEWGQPGTIQAQGLGDPLRQHHAKGSFPSAELSLLGDLYTFGADFRDSALDKGSGNTRSGAQRAGAGFRADSFGNESEPYTPELLAELWRQTGEVVREVLLNDGAWSDVPKARRGLRERIEPIFRQALGETRRPTNDVTLWHHAHSAASLFKTAVAEGVLRRSFRHLQNDQGQFDTARLGRVRFRLLGVRWDWAALARGALRPAAFAALRDRRDEAVDELRQLLEVDRPIGNVVYEDDDGVVLVMPGFFEPDDAGGAHSEALYRQHILEPLLTPILNALAALGPGAPVRIAWTAPVLYLTDYHQVMGSEPDGRGREVLRQVGEEELRRLWARPHASGQVEICMQCGLRPTRARELALNESGLGPVEAAGGLCDCCFELVGREARHSRWRTTMERFGFRPETFNLQEMRTLRDPGNPRVALISVSVERDAVLSGAALATQLARPFDEQTAPKTCANANAAGEFLQTGVLNVLMAQPSEAELQRLISRNSAKEARAYVGDRYWLDFHEQDKDGRIEWSGTDKAWGVVQEFFLREPVPEGLARHDGDRLLLFGMRKHASPARLARLWDDLRDLWRDMLIDIAHMSEGHALPLSLDAQGFRVIVAARDARAALQTIQTMIVKRLSKVRASIAPHVSAVLFREKFPLYVAFDGLRRLESRISSLTAQEWRMVSCEEQRGRLRLLWDTPPLVPEGAHGTIAWDVDLGTGDPQQADLWHPHVVCLTRPQGPERLVALRALKPGDIVCVRPATFDFAVLEGTARRYHLVYDADGRRPHFVLGESGRRPYLLEQMEAVLDLLPVGLKNWTSSQRKGIQGQVVESYGRWVRDVPEPLREQGRRAWHLHVGAILARYLPKQPELQAQVMELLHDGRFFDAYEWTDFFEKSQVSRVESMSTMLTETRP